MIRLGVCVPALNAAPTLRQTLESLEAQAPGIAELVLCNNGSSDATGKIMEEFASASSLKVNVRHFDAPLGMAADWNRAAAELQTEWRCVFPADDLALPGWAEAHIRQISEFPRTALSVTAKRLVSARGWVTPLTVARMPRGWMEPSRAWKRALATSFNAIGEPGAVVFHWRAFERSGGFDPSLWYYADLDAWLRMMDHGGTVFDSTPHYGFRVHGRSLTGPGMRKAAREWQRVREAFGCPLTVRDRLRMRLEAIARRIAFRVLSAI